MSGDSDAVSAQFAEILAQMKKLDTIEAKLQNLEVAQHTQQLAITRFKSGQAVTAMADASLGVPRAPPLASPNDCLLATTSMAGTYPWSRARQATCPGGERGRPPDPGKILGKFFKREKIQIFF